MFDFGLGLIFEHNMIIAVVTNNLSALMNQLQQIGVLLDAVAVHEEDGFSLVLV
ncbi:hypothetical protein D3C80_2213700 [compost metagenome]